MAIFDFDLLEKTENSKKTPSSECEHVTDIPVPPGRRLRVYLISDLHIDYKANRQWLQGCLDQLNYNGDLFFNCLVLPGDVCDSEATFEEVMNRLVSAFDVVCFCFGNHELWTRGEKNGTLPVKTSLEKLARVNAICSEVGVYTTPVRLLQNDVRASVLLLPLWSWYHSGFDTEPDLPKALQPPIDPADRVVDYTLCKWGELERRRDFAFGGDRTSEVLAQFFADHNEAWIRAVLDIVENEGGHVFTFSHFCPRIELTLEKKNSFDNHLARITGSQPLERQIRRVQPVCHAFGHTHVPWDAVLDGVRYINWGLGNVRERMGQSRAVNAQGPMLVYDGEEWSPVQFAHWSYYYERLASRVPGSAELAPWVVRLFLTAYPDMKPELERRRLIEGDISAAFPGGAANNGPEFWDLHQFACHRWRCPTEKVPEGVDQEYPCDRKDCILCNFNLEQEGKHSAWWVRAGRISQN